MGSRRLYLVAAFISRSGGAIMSLIIISCVLSLSLIWAVNACARSAYWGLAGACVLTAGLTILPAFLMCIFFEAVALQSLLTFVLLLCCIIFRRKPTAAFPLSIAAMVASYGFCFFSAYGRIQDLSQLRERFPLQSVSERLAYEGHSLERGADAESASGTPVLSSEVDQRLTLHEEARIRSGQSWRHNRRTMLASLHTRQSDDFALAQGFGRVRMMPGFVSEREIELPQADPIAIPNSEEPAYKSGQDSPDAVADHDDSPLLRVTPENLLSLHESGMADFVAPDRIGYVQDRNHVAGFQSHGFTKIPELSIARDQSPAAWKVVRLELVSLLKHRNPVAYISKHLPQMDELRDAPTRALEAFERQSLEQLKSEEDVVIDETADRIRMVGSLRAAKNCLDCHSVQRGELLGALTYELVPAKKTRKKAASASSPSS
jgi:hypothetical protein